MHTLDAVIFEIWALRPDCLSGAVSKQIKIKSSFWMSASFRYYALITNTGVCPACIFGEQKGVLEEKVGFGV